MTEWLLANIGTIAAALVVITVILLVVRGMVRDRKKGRTSCGSNCSHCAMAGKCHGTMTKR